jgi:hypothetical protein
MEPSWKRPVVMFLFPFFPFLFFFFYQMHSDAGGIVTEPSGHAGWWKADGTTRQATHGARFADAHAGE